MELLKSAWQIRKNAPSIHSHFWISVIFPPGPMGPGFISPSRVQEPARTSSFFSSGPGLGISICANAAAARTVHTAKVIPAFFMAYLLDERRSLGSKSPFWQADLRPASSGSQRAPHWTGRALLCNRYFVITPQAMRSPELPEGSVL